MYQIGTVQKSYRKIDIQITIHPSQHKGRRVSLRLRQSGKGITKTYQRKKIIKLDNCSDELFISPVVITVKKDKTV